MKVWRRRRSIASWWVRLITWKTKQNSKSKWPQDNMVKTSKPWILSLAASRQSLPYSTNSEHVFALNSHISLRVRRKQWCLTVSRLKAFFRVELLHRLIFLGQGRMRLPQTFLQFFVHFIYERQLTLRSRVDSIQLNKASFMLSVDC